MLNFIKIISASNQDFIEKLYNNLYHTWVIGKFVKNLSYKYSHKDIYRMMKWSELVFIIVLFGMMYTSIVASINYNVFEPTKVAIANYDREINIKDILADYNKKKDEESKLSKSDKQVTENNDYIYENPKADENLILDTCQTMNITNKDQLAYILATADWEASVKPIEEYFGREQARKLGYDGGENYFGRGYVQLTGLGNYKNWSNWLSIDLVNKPELALEPVTASKILCSGIKFGSFAPKAGKLDDYVRDDHVDFVSARSLVNGDRDYTASKKWTEFYGNSTVGERIARRANEYANALIHPNETKLGTLIAPLKYGFTSNNDGFNINTHWGIDIVCSGQLAGREQTHYDECKQIMAIADGVVIDTPKAMLTPDRHGASNTLCIRSNINYRNSPVIYCYAHLASFTPKTGDTIKQSQVVGIMGKSGHTNGLEHLHIELTTDPNAMSAINPRLFISDEEFNKNILTV